MASRQRPPAGAAAGQGRKRRGGAGRRGEHAWQNSEQRWQARQALRQQAALLSRPHTTLLTRLLAAAVLGAAVEQRNLQRLTLPLLSVLRGWGEQARAQAAVSGRRCLQPMPLVHDSSS